MNFEELHGKKTPLLICNVWDVVSAKTAQKLNFQAIGTSSSAIASAFGYNDGEEISFQEVEYVVNRITQSVDIPLTVDLEAGYADNALEIAENILRLVRLGAVGINIEDSVVRNGKREILDSDIFHDLLSEVCLILARHKANVFINVRTDTFLLNLSDAAQETIQRAIKYKEAGANGLFVPCIENVKDIEAVVDSIALPLNVMCMPKLPEFEVLAELGVKRISMGNFVFDKVNHLLENELNLILQNGSFKSVFNG